MQAQEGYLFYGAVAVCAYLIGVLEPKYHQSTTMTYVGHHIWGMPRGFFAPHEAATELRPGGDLLWANDAGPRIPGLKNEQKHEGKQRKATPTNLGGGSDLLKIKATHLSSLVLFLRQRMWCPMLPRVKHKMWRKALYTHPALTTSGLATGVAHLRIVHSTAETVLAAVAKPVSHWASLEP